MYSFDYHKAKSVTEAAKLLKEKTDGKLLAGGMTLIPTLKQRLASPSDLIDLNAIPDLRGIADVVRFAVARKRQWSDASSPQPVSSGGRPGVI